MKTTISMIASHDDHLGIGKNNKLPWHLSADLKRFKKLTIGHPIIMGRKTFESIGKSLPGRTNIIITRTQKHSVPKRNVYYVNSLNDAKPKTNKKSLLSAGERYTNKPYP